MAGGYQVAVQTVMDRARRRANLQGDGALDFISETELLDEFNASYAEWWDMIRLTTWAGQYIRKASNPITTVADQSLYSLPDDFLALISIDCYITVGGPQGIQVIAAEPYQEEERNAFKWYPTMFQARGPVYYQLQGGTDDGTLASKVNFIPAPIAAVSIIINYVPVATKFTDAATTFDSFNEWDMWMVYDLALKLLIGDGQTDIIPALAQERERQRARILSAAPARDTSRGERVHDVESSGGGVPPWFR